MRTINLLIAKLYYNTKYGISESSKGHLWLSQISVSLIILFWFSVFIKTIRIALNLEIAESLSWVYIILFFVFFYFLNKTAWKLTQVEEFINDEKNEETLKRMIWVFWATLIIPTLVLLILKK